MDSELQRLGAESDRVEWKPSLAQKDKILKAACALANDLPGYGGAGYIVVGLNNDGSCAGLTVDDDLLKALSEMRSDGSLTPFPVLAVQEHRVAECDVAVVTVHPSEAPPVRLRGRVWVRVGPTTRQATAEEERRLLEKRRAADLPFDLRPLPSASLEDLDLEMFRRSYLPAALAPDVLEQNERSLQDQLRSLRFASLDTPPRPTVLGVLALGQEPRSFVPGSYVQFLRVEGTELTDPIKDQKEIDGPLQELLAKLDELLKVHITVAAEVASVDREFRRPDYPLAALQQLVRNAVLHRSYDGTNAPVRMSWFSDRIEISSPGGPYGQVTRENFGQAGVTDYRNPHLAEVMKNLGYVQRFGLGIQLARQQLRRNGNPEPEFQVFVSHVLVIVRKAGE